MEEAKSEDDDTRDTTGQGGRPGRQTDTSATNVSN